MEQIPSVALPKEGFALSEYKSALMRPKNPMPDFVRNALEGRWLMDAYRARPPYQQNDYLGWIAGAKLEATKQKRLNQMLDELEGGMLYMNMNRMNNYKIKTPREASSFPAFGLSQLYCGKPRMLWFFEALVSARGAKLFSSQEKGGFNDREKHMGSVL